jgi:hypothetical protein
MKRSHLLFIGIVTICFCACKKSGNNPKPAVNLSIVGKWSLSHRTSNKYISKIATADSTNIAFQNTYLTFQNDGTATYTTAFGDSDVFKYKIINSALIISGEKNYYNHNFEDTVALYHLPNISGLTAKYLNIQVETIVLNPDANWDLVLTDYYNKL